MQHSTILIFSGFMLCGLAACADPEVEALSNLTVRANLVYQKSSVTPFSGVALATWSDGKTKCTAIYYQGQSTGVVSFTTSNHLTNSCPALGYTLDLITNQNSAYKYSYVAKPINIRRENSAAQHTVITFEVVQGYAKGLKFYTDTGYRAIRERFYELVESGDPICVSLTDDLFAVDMYHQHRAGLGVDFHKIDPSVWKKVLQPKLVKQPKGEQGNASH